MKKMKNLYWKIYDAFMLTYSTLFKNLFSCHDTPNVKIYISINILIFVKSLFYSVCLSVCPSLSLFRHPSLMAIALSKWSR